MCGIVGAVAGRDVVPVLIEGLRRLEYRGYDSAGVAVLNGTGSIKRLRTVGKVRKLEDALEEDPTHGPLGIAHALGDAWCAERAQRASAYFEGRHRDRPQRHHREP
jgi:glucosamine 6-phosphate synthetase-like amidotransferase/phosphosugar isomerase protein